jgi:hypothetical protein
MNQLGNITKEYKELATHEDVIGLDIGMDDIGLPQ